MTKHQYICQIAEVVRLKSDCAKRKVGAVFVNSDFEILATGYNAPPRGFPHCDAKEVGHYENCGYPCTRNVHAEMNAIAQAAKRGTALKNSILYCTYTPCVDCARLLVNIGILEARVMDMNEDGGFDVLQKSDIPVILWGFLL